MHIIQFLNATTNATLQEQAFATTFNGILSFFFIYFVPFFVVFAGAIAVIKTATED